MNNITFCELLKGHEGEIFYCSLVGQEVKLVFINGNRSISVEYINKEDENGDIIAHLVLYPNGSNYKGRECLLFPSKDQRDWNKWVEEQNLKVSKPWNELVKTNQNKSYGFVIGKEIENTNKRSHENPWCENEL